ncbi:hypothetical protein GCM10010168_63360 [Actinoplanes ianthinogenes]|uniref:ABC transporter permease n=1 Tax=Actinoplanes ianthinogenes TaxID=122358 RepID=A0ABM7LJJ0_9ACTN|nr:hypothetical protein [Actinoplanes ianthinogenes]BCJ39416.1 hypothetical protein Aiant_00730 [Actinoplanes ianthinogenes]GGR36266.1 hypothetical protein GCM10010168_63360 [Actinoplanes ianthinogenes]
MPTTDTEHSPWPRVAGAVALLTVIISVLLTAFAWPSVRSSVHDVPIAVAGPAAAAQQVVAALDQRAPGGFAITRVDSTVAAEQLIRDREVYGAIDLSTGTPQVITASAGSATIAQTLQSIATGLSQARSGAAPAVTTRDLVPLPADDPRGAGLSAGALPLVMGGLLAAVLLTNLIKGAARRVAGALAFAVTGGLAMAAILQFWFGSLDGAYLLNAGVIALTVGATSMTLLGLESLLGYAGFALGGVLMMLVGNPFSGATSAPEMLPGWGGALGQLLPPGAGGQLLRSTAFFDGSGAIHPVVVLCSWLVAGVLLCLAGGVRARRRTENAAAVSEAVTEPVAV